MRTGHKNTVEIIILVYVSSSDLLKLSTSLKIAKFWLLKITGLDKMFYETFETKLFVGSVHNFCRSEDGV